MDTVVVYGIYNAYKKKIDVTKIQELGELFGILKENQPTRVKTTWNTEKNQPNNVKLFIIFFLDLQLDSITEA